MWRGHGASKGPLLSYLRTYLGEVTYLRTYLAGASKGQLSGPAPTHFPTPPRQFAPIPSRRAVVCSTKWYVVSSR